AGHAHRTEATPVAAAHCNVCLAEEARGLATLVSSKRSRMPRQVACGLRIHCGSKEHAMKSSKSILITLIALVAVALPGELAAQHTRYKLIDIGTFGGPASYVNPAPAMGSPDQVNSSGTTVGGALTSIATTSTSNRAIVCGGIEGILLLVNHAFQWQNGVLTDLGSLAGPNNCSVALSINASGEISGRSENG